MYSIPAKPEPVFNPLSATPHSMAKRFFHRLDRFLAALALAEAGDLDAVKEILAQGRAESRSAS